MSTTQSWWRDATIYQVYISSFSDTDGDGFGDLDGITNHLPYLADLGVDGLWLTPCYPSPRFDHGYDVENYTDIDPRYGTLSDFDSLVEEAHRRGLRVLLDLVPNHCAVTHPWFSEAIAAAPGSAARARFHFADGRGGAGDRPPNDWRSMFGGPAWTQLPATTHEEQPQWYLHLFTPGQPDLNWRHPNTGPMFDAVLRFWLDRGVDGFRIDAAQGLFKHPELADGQDPTADERAQDAANPEAWNQPEVHDVYRRWRSICDEYTVRDGRERALVGEVTGFAGDYLADYLQADELHQAFFFDLLKTPFESAGLHAAINRGLAFAEATDSSPTWVLGNHDTTRVATRYGTDQARAALLLLAALPGSLYLYQGDELGLPEYVDLPDEARTDPIFHRTGGTRPGRDGCRIPMPWKLHKPSFGFSTAGTTWLPQPQWFGNYTADQQRTDPESTYSLHKDALRLRRELRLGRRCEITWLDAAPSVLAFIRDGLVCLVNTSDEPVAAPQGERILASGRWKGTDVPTGHAGWWRCSLDRSGVGGTEG